MSKQTVKCAIDRDIADFIVEVYYWDYKLVDNVVKKKTKQTVAYVPMFKDWDIDEGSQIERMLEIKAKLEEAYQDWPDGEIHVELVITNQCVNI